MTSIDITPDHATVPADAVPQPPKPALFYSPGASAGTTQWKVETMQLVNWGGFEGRVQFDFHDRSTLITGASGSGKSTMLDAYIALMMPSDTPFNGASNDAGGRARGAEQRHLLSYLRGQIDTTADSDGRERPKVLRGERTATWGAVGMTFVNDTGRRFTALRVYYVPARATRTGDITMRMATLDGHIDLADLAVAVDSAFAPKALKTAFPGMKTHDSYAAFANTLHTRLGIGANGDGEKALRLLVRVQAGHQIRTVDELYKDLVLERPTTYAAADRAIEHFDDLETAYLAMVTEQQKADLLAPITKAWQTRETARTELATLDTFGAAREGDTPLYLWTLRTEQKLLEAAVDTNRTARAENEDNLRRARQDVASLDNELEAAREAHRAAGGGDLERLAAAIEDENVVLDNRHRRRAALADRTTALGAPLATKADFDSLQAAAAKFLAEYEARETDLDRQRDAYLHEQFPMSERQRILVEEKASLQGRSGRVPKSLDDWRNEAAAAAGLDPTDLPFVAELIDIPDHQSRWRTAIETVLSGSARILLVPDDKLAQFSKAINPLRLRGRVRFEGVTPEPHHDAPPSDPARIAGKLTYADSPYSAWVCRHLADPARNALCVDTPDDLNGPGLRVTAEGQTRHGRRGAHGTSASQHIIGFSSADAIAAIDTELEELKARLDALGTRRTALEEQRAALRRTKDAYEAVRAAVWDDIDAQASEDRIRELESAREQILASDDKLRALAAHIEGVADRLEHARRRKFDHEARREKLATEHAELTDREDDVNDEVDRITASGVVVLTDTDISRLDEEFAAAAAPADPASYPDFVANLARLKNRLRDAGETARKAIKSSEDELCRIFELYQLKWEDTNLSTDVASYHDYARILENILQTGLHERRQEWRTRLTKWSGEDLVPLAGALENAIVEIEDRMEPINAILATLPFGANRDRLVIRLRRLNFDNVTTFRRQLRTLSSAATTQLTEDQMERRFRELQAFMAKIRSRNDPRAVPEVSDRDRLLDVRRHVEITAERHSPDGQLLSTHSTLGNKSGGESQELIAFIVGAALRFRLGDDENERPTFAPVFLDEAFIKADSEFAGRAVQAWLGLGFQLIVGAPLDKVTALEPHMDELLSITKNTRTNYSFVQRLRDADRHAAP